MPYNGFAIAAATRTNWQNKQNIVTCGTWPNTMEMHDFQVDNNRFKLNFSMNEIDSISSYFLFGFLVLNVVEEKARAKNQQTNNDNVKMVHWSAQKMTKCNWMNEMEKIKSRRMPGKECMIHNKLIMRIILLDFNNPYLINSGNCLRSVFTMLRMVPNLFVTFFI